MKRSSLLIAAAAFLSGAASAAPFTGKGLPADSVAFVHLDGEAATSGELSKVIRSSLKQGQKKSSDITKVLAEIGLKGDFRDISLGISPDAAGKAGVSGIIHGTYDATQFNGIKKRHPEVAAKNVGGLTWYDADDIATAAGVKQVKKTAAEDVVYVTLADANTLVIANAARLDKAAAAASGKASSFAVPAGAKSLVAGSPTLVGWFPEEAVKAFQGGAQTGMPSVKALSFTLAEITGNVNLAAAATMKDASAATQINGVAAFYQMGAYAGLTKKTADAKKNADNAFMASLIKALKFSAQGADFKVALSYPAAELAAKIAEKQGEIIEAAGSATK